MDAVDRSVSTLIIDIIEIGKSRDLDTSRLPELVIQPVSISQVIKIEGFDWTSGDNSTDACWPEGESKKKEHDAHT
jgi:hypothetical protein